MAVRALQTWLDEAKETARRVNRREELFGWPLSEHSEMAAMQQLLQPYVDIWGSAAEVSALHPAWLHGKFIELDADEVAEKQRAWSAAIMWNMCHSVL